MILLFSPPFLSWSIDKISKVTSPVLVIHGTEDEVIDFSHGLAMYERCPRAVEPLWVEGAGHNDIELYAQYLERLKQFISHELPNSWRRQLDLTSLTVNTSPPFYTGFHWTAVLAWSPQGSAQLFWHPHQRAEDFSVFRIHRFYRLTRHVKPNSCDFQLHCLAGREWELSGGATFLCCKKGCSHPFLHLTHHAGCINAGLSLSLPVFSVFDLQLSFSHWIHGFSPFVKLW